MKRCYSCFKEYSENYSVCPHCGHIEINNSLEPIDLVPGTILANRYIVGEKCGSGGFGIVYKAWDSKLEIIIAVKEFYVSRLMTRAAGLKNVIVNRKSQEEYEYRKKRFLAEAKTMAQFGSHKSIPNVFEFFEENNTAYIVMEYLNGLSLNKYLIQNNGVISTDLAIHIAFEVANALKSLHEEKVIHRDVAPDNIFICTGKEIKIKLMDLGAAKLADGTDEGIDKIMKPGYSPPEQYEDGRNIGTWTDIYALGATLYMMLTGIKPDESTNRKINDIVVPPDQINPSISENLSNTIMKAMAIEIHMRFKNVNEFLKALSGEIKVVTLAKEKRVRKFRRFSGILAACAALAIISVFVFQTFISKKTENELDPAAISVWFSVADNSSEEEAMKSVFEDFQSKYQNVKIDYRAIPSEEYESTILAAARNNTLPNLFESTDLPDEVFSKTIPLDSVVNSPQYKECIFLDQYSACYPDKKQIPLGIEVPVAYIITSGKTDTDYKGDYFTSISDFGNVNISYDDRYAELLSKNFEITGLSNKESFLGDGANTSPVLISSSMIINEVRALRYEKKYVFCNAKPVYCNYVYEWSISEASQAEKRASEMLLSWMLGNDYQRKLMVNSGGKNQVPEIPINKECFETKIKYLNSLNPLTKIYDSFVFDKEGKKQ